MDEKKLIEAAMLLKDFCADEMHGKCFTEKCLFLNGERCRLSDHPTNWSIPKLRRWTDADIALAKALKAFGAHDVERVSNGGIRVIQYFHNCGAPTGSFRDLKMGEMVSLGEIIAEGDTK